MFPGCTELEMRTRYQELLHEAEQRRLLRHAERESTYMLRRAAQLGRAALQQVLSLLAFIGI